MDPIILTVLLVIGAYLYTDYKKTLTEFELKEANELIQAVANKASVSSDNLMANVAEGGSVALAQLSQGGVSWEVVKQASTGATHTPNWSFAEDEDFWLNFVEQDAFGKALDEGWGWLEDSLVADEKLDPSLSLAGFEFKVVDDIGYIRHDDPLWGAASWVKQSDYIKANPQMFP
jgi:hypothetical protein